MCGVVLDKSEALSAHPNVDKFVVHAQDDLLWIKVFVKNIESEKALETITNDFLNPMLDRLSFDLEVEVGKPHLESKDIIDVDNDEHVLINASVSLGCHIAAILKPGPKRLQRLINFISHTNSIMDIYISFFSFAVRQTNPVARFLFLYNILLAINEDKQSAVDKYIVAEEPKTQQSQSPVQKRMETIYTRLRNEVAHARHGSVIEQTYKEIASNLSNFQRLVKAAILRVE